VPQVLGGEGLHNIIDSRGREGLRGKGIKTTLNLQGSRPRIWGYVIYSPNTFLSSLTTRLLVRANSMGTEEEEKEKNG